MKRFWRYLLVVLLVSGMAVDPALARRFFQRKCRAKKCCPTVCVPQTCSTCPAPCGDLSCDGQPDAPCGVIESHAPETACHGCSTSVPSETTSEELVVPAIPELSEPTQNSVVEEPSLAPVPVAAPEPSETAAPTEPLVPPTDESPATDIVGDRYSEDSLFDPPAPEAEAPPAEATPTDPSPGEQPTDVFGDPVAPAQEPPAEDPVPEPETGQEPDSEEDLDDIFGATEPGIVEEESEEEIVDEPIPAESDEEPADESYDPFGQATPSQENRVSVLEAAGGLQSNRSRTWTDNTASYQCQAKLLRVTTKQVILKQDSGEKIVVAFARLADNDLQFVREQVTALRIARARGTATEKLAAVWPTH